MICMAKVQLNFRIDEVLKDRFDTYCSDNGLLKERVLEAMVYAAVVLEKPSADDLFAYIKECNGAIPPAAVPTPSAGTLPVDPKLKGGAAKALAAARSKHKVG
jgi:hypothetical protein